MISTKHTFCFDIDGTLCEIKPETKEYSEVTPFKDMIAEVNKLYDNNYHIILFTSRGMRTYDGNINAINREIRPVLEKWLETHNVKYHELIMGKPWGNNVTYVDDKAMTPSHFKLMMKYMNNR